MDFLHGKTLLCFKIDEIRHTTLLITGPPRGGRRNAFKWTRGGHENNNERKGI